MEGGINASWLFMMQAGLEWKLGTGTAARNRTAGAIDLGFHSF